MKNVLLLLLCLFSLTAFAQHSSQSVSVTKTKDTFTYHVKLDNSRSKELSDAYLKLVHGKKDPGVSEINGTSEMETANGTTISLNTRRGTLKIESNKDNKSSMLEAERYAEALKGLLKLQEGPTPPTPPAPPKIN